MTLLPLSGIPTSLLILAVTNRRGEREVRQRPDYPPVVVVNPGNTQPRYLQRFGGLTAPPFQAPLLQGQERQFRVIGDEDVVLDGGRYF